MTTYWKFRLPRATAAYSSKTEFWLERIKHIGLKLLQSLVRQDQTDIEFARLIEDDQDFWIAFDEVVTLVDVDKARETLLFWQKLAFMRGQQDHRDKKSADDFDAITKTIRTEFSVHTSYGDFRGLQERV